MSNIFTINKLTENEKLGLYEEAFRLLNRANELLDNIMKECKKKESC